MVTTSNTTTTRLEGFGAARGLEGFGVVKSGGRFFCVRLSGRTLTRWISLGWTRAEAEEAITRLAADVPLTLSETGYSFQA